jgi:surface carbohydrate biosynthesis protein
MRKKRVVILIDSKKRDLMGAALISYHLQNNGVDVLLEPLESWRACLHAWSPDMIIFNHLIHSHLCKYTVELKKYGVIVGCLLNEGAFLNKEELDLMSKKHYNYVHCDFFLTWNDEHRDKLVYNQFCTPSNNVYTIGVPRFDFYHEPWSRLYSDKNTTKSDLLINTTFQCAHYYGRSEKEKMLVYSGLGGGKSPNAVNYLKLINLHYNGRLSLIEFLYRLLKESELIITLRPHPREDCKFYINWHKNLSSELKKRLIISVNRDIASDIINNKVIINCGTCTTALESWISNKPTLSLVYSDDEFTVNGDLILKLSPIINIHDKIDIILKKIHEAIEIPTQDDFLKERRKLIYSLFNLADGNSSSRAAGVICEFLGKKEQFLHIPFNLAGIRRAIKLRFLNLFGCSYNASPVYFVMYLFHKYLPEKTSIKYNNYIKSINPKDVVTAINSIKKLILSNFS